MKWREDMKEFCGGGLELAFLSPYLGIPGSVCQAPPSAWTLSDYGKPAHHTVHGCTVWRVDEKWNLCKGRNLWNLPTSSCYSYNKIYTPYSGLHIYLYMIWPWPFIQTHPLLLSPLDCILATLASLLVFKLSKCSPHQKHFAPCFPRLECFPHDLAMAYCLSPWRSPFKCHFLNEASPSTHTAVSIHLLYLIFFHSKYHCRNLYHVFICYIFPLEWRQSILIVSI